MKHLVLACVAVLAFSTTTMAVEIAISTQANWWGQAAADREMQEIVDNVTAVSVERFASTELDALAAWVQDHTGDGVSDLLIMCGAFPATLYQAGNAQPEGSLAELFLDDGNCIINTGDYMFYVGTAGNNDAGGLQNMMDIAGITMWDDDTSVNVTVEGQEYTPSLQNLASDRPFHLDELEGDWEAELILAQNDAGTRADPVIVVNTETGGRLGIFFQTASQPDDPRGEVISEWINNWYLAIAGGGGNPYARRPEPADGALFFETWGTLTWKPGHYAVSHDVYVGTSFDDVNDGAADTFIGNQGSNMQILGFPGFPFPEGLVPGTTYYWRVDEVNDANAASPWKGNVWSFSIPPKTGYNPVPADGAKFIAGEDLELAWEAGYAAKLHTVYFGESFDEVDSAAGGLPQATTTFTPPTALEPEKTYYWRVDEFDVVATHKGPVWSFTTAREGGGVKGEYFQGMTPGGTPALTRTDPTIDFNWGDPGGPDPLVGDDNFSCRWTGEVEAAFTETYTFYAAADDGVRLWIDGVQLVNAWVDQGTTEYRGEIDLVAGNTYSVVMEQYENGGGATAYLRWSSPSTPKQIIPQAALSLLVHAHSPSPSSGTDGVNLMSDLTWGAGDFAASHEVYLGTDADAVANATKASPEYKGSKALGEESLDPGKLAFDTTYYWRVDEIDT
ncbi:MAG: PA14 domain-containing protein, partial [Planctomycetota bacterium]